jgi:hypothetical protein
MPKPRTSRLASALVAAMAFSSEAFMNQPHVSTGSMAPHKTALHLAFPRTFRSEESPHLPDVGKMFSTFAASAALVLFLGSSPAFAENELSDKYGGKGFDSSLVDQTCLVDRCGTQAKACLADDPSCRKGLTCTAKCLGDNSCITGCMARYGNKNLDNLLKCTIEDHECIKIAILPGGSDKFGEEPRAPAPTVRNFDYKSMEGTWYKVVGFNPNYDCYACQRNTFAVPKQDGLVNVVNSADALQMGVEFSMPHLMPDGSPLPPKNIRESIAVKDDAMFGSKSIGLNDYQTNEVMVFDKINDPLTSLVVNKGKDNEASYSRTAHSEGEMFGLSKCNLEFLFSRCEVIFPTVTLSLVAIEFWENWYVIGENDPDMPEFKFVYYNGKTRQNTYEGAFVYSRSKVLEPESMKKVYDIAQKAGMNPNQFCRIRNGCFDKDGSNAVVVPDFPTSPATPNNAAFRGIMASTKVSELLGVEAVSARDDLGGRETSRALQPPASSGNRPWWYEVGDYLENPHRHFETMYNLRQTMEWPEEFTKGTTTTTTQTR